MLTKILENIGLNAKEAKVYLAALEIGSNPVSKIAAKAKINRVTTYDIIEKLTKKGLISSFTRAKVKYFTATDPEVVITDFQRKVGELKNVLPDLQRLSGETVHPRVRYFEGFDGIRHIYEDTLTSKTEILNYGDSEEIRKHWPSYDEDYVAKRADKKIFLRGIALDDEYGRKVVQNNTDYNREIRLIPKDKFNFSNEIHIYDDKVAIISYKDELIGMIIESPEIANTQRSIFSMVWEFSGAYDYGKNDKPTQKTKEEKTLTKNVPIKEEEPPEPEQEVVVENKAWQQEPEEVINEEQTENEKAKTDREEIKNVNKEEASDIDVSDIISKRLDGIAPDPKQPEPKMEPTPEPQYEENTQTESKEEQGQTQETDIQQNENNREHSSIKKEPPADPPVLADQAVAADPPAPEFNEEEQPPESVSPPPANTFDHKEQGSLF